MINIEELKHVMKRIGDVMSKEEIEAFLSTVKVNRDGFMGMETLVEMFKG
jgi:Ca2+-binding EF-hand superfamily protein